MIASERIFAFAGSAIAVLLQLFLAPYLAIGAVVPNFIVAFVLALAVTRPAKFGCVLPFVLGLLFDFVGGGAVGAMAFSLTAFSVLSAFVFMRVDNDSLFMAVAVLALGVLLVDVSYAALVVLAGFDASFFAAVAFRALPCFLYDFVLAAVAFPLARRFGRPSVATRTELTQLR